MARSSWIARNERKKKTVAKYAALRAQLKAEKDYVGLSMLPRDASPTRLVNRCAQTGRRHGFPRATPENGGPFRARVPTDRRSAAAGAGRGEAR